MKNARFLAIFCGFWYSFVVVNQGNTDLSRMYIVHMSCFQSLLCSLYYL